MLTAGRRARWHVLGRVPTHRANSLGGFLGQARIAEEHSTTGDKHDPARPWVPSASTSYAKRSGQRQLCSGSLRPYFLGGGRTVVCGHPYCSEPRWVLFHRSTITRRFNLPLFQPARVGLACKVANVAPGCSPLRFLCSFSSSTFLLPFTGARKRGRGAWLRIRRGGSSLSRTERSRGSTWSTATAVFKVVCLVLIFLGQALVTERQDGVIQGWCHEAFEE